MHTTKFKYWISSFLILFMYANFSVAQKADKKDKYKFLLQFDFRNAFINKTKIRVIGLKIGLGNSKNRFGLGFYGMGDQVVPATYNQPNNAFATNQLLVNYRYNSVFYERVVYHSRRWEVSVPLHYNFGTLNAKYKNINDSLIPLFIDKKVRSITLSVKSHYKIWRWFGFGAGIGYNIMLDSDKQINKVLNAPFYSFGIKIFLGELWNGLIGKKTEWDEGK